METSSATGSPHAAGRVLRSGGRRCATLGLLALGAGLAVLATAGGASADEPLPPGPCGDLVCLPPTQCADLRDNDGDGKVDYPADPGCSGYSDNDETDSVQPPPPPPGPKPQCS